MKPFTYLFAAVLVVLTGPLVAQDQGTPVPPLWQTNQTASSLDFNGTLVANPADPMGKAVTEVLASNYVRATLGGMTGQGFDALLSAAPLVPATAPNALTTNGGQIVNVDLSHPSTTWLNGGLGPVFQPHPGTQVFDFEAPMAPFIASAQQVVVDPAHPDGLALSQASELVVRAAVVLPGPTSDDGTVLVDLSPLGGAVSFLNRNYTQVGVSSNGRVTLGGTDPDFSATVGEARTDLPSVGYWTDLDPSSGGTIEVVDTGRSLSVNWMGVPYFGESATVSFSVVFDRPTRDVRIAGLRGISANPLSAVSPSDAAFLGVSAGDSATGGQAIDAGFTVFGLGGAGTNGSRNEMLYDFLDPASLTAGSPDRVPSLRAGTLQQLLFSTTAGITTWIGF